MNSRDLVLDFFGSGSLIFYDHDVILVSNGISMFDRL